MMTRIAASGRRSVHSRLVNIIPVAAALLALFACSAPAATPRPGSASPVLSPLASAPLYFEPNCGQADSSVKFLARGGKCQFLLAPTAAQLVFCHSEHSSAPQSELPSHAVSQMVADQSVRLEFLGANPAAAMQGDSSLAGRINYLVGADSKQWHTGLPTFARVQVANLYPGIDLVYYSKDQQLEYDFTLAPGTDPAAIAIRFDGADKVTIDPQGDLVLSLGKETIHQHRPVLFQLVNGRRMSVDGSFRLAAPNTVAFTVGAYDRSLPLVIDPPVLTFSSYLGGNGTAIPMAVQVDAAGSVYVAGIAHANVLPFEVWQGALTNGAPADGITPSVTLTNRYHNGRFNGDAFVAKFDSTFTNLDYFTYLGGTNDDGANGLALDNNGNVYVTGFTDSTNFPITSPTIAGLTNGIRGPVSHYPPHTFMADVFVSMLNTNGSSLIYSTYLGGSDADVGQAIAVDDLGNAYITGYTYSTNFPVTTNAFQTKFGGTNWTINAFLTRIATDGTNMDYSTYLGGTNVDYGESVAVLGDSGIAFIAGYTTSTNFPTTPGAWQVNQAMNHSTNAFTQFHHVFNPPSDAFVAEFDTSLTNADSLVYSTLLGGTNIDVARHIVVDALTNVYVTGYTYSMDFPTNTSWPGFFSSLVPNRNRHHTNSDVFLTKFNFTQTPPLVASVMFGGTNNDYGFGLALEPTTRNLFLVGTTSSTNFPTLGAVVPPLASTNSGLSDVFIAAVSNDLSSVTYCALLGGSGYDYGYGVAATPDGTAYVVGQTLSTDFPEINPFQHPMQRTNDGFLARIEFPNPDQNMTVTLQTDPLGLDIVVDGITNTTRILTTNRPNTTNYTGHITVNWPAGSLHQIGVVPVQTNTTGTAIYRWAFWSDGGAWMHAPAISTNVTLTATFDPQFYLNMEAITQGGVATPPSGWYDAGSTQTLVAIPAPGYTFTGWSGDRTSADNPLSLTLTNSITVAANFLGTPTSRLTVLTSGQGTVTPDYTGKPLVNGRSYPLTATPAAGWNFAGWSGGVNTNAAKISFIQTDGLALQATFVSNSIASYKGNYAGLFYDTDANIFEQTFFNQSGRLTVSVTDKGRLSGRVAIGGSSYSFSGGFTNGAYLGSIRRSGSTNLSRLLVHLLLGDTNTALVGEVSDSFYTSPLQPQAFRSGFSATNPPPQSGRHYTALIPACPNWYVLPGGDSFGTFSVNNSGIVSFSGSLADGTRVTQSSFISGQGDWPFYASAGSKRGSLLGWLAFDSNPAAEADVQGTLYWHRPVQPRVRYYPAGFTYVTNFSGYRYTNISPVLNFTNGNGLLVLSNGYISQTTNALTPQPIISPVSLASNNAVNVVGANTNKIKLTVTPATGLFRGTFVNPVNRKRVSFSGAVFQKLNYASGFFRGTNQAGRVILQPGH